jgi:PST family polysaccharide transporter
VSLRDKTISGLGWTTTARIVQQILQFVISVLLARLLTPEAFGLVGMIFIFTGFASMFSDGGFGAALVQAESIEERHRSSVFWLNVLIGLVLTGIVILAAPWVAWFYGEPTLEPLTVVIAFQFIIGALSNVHTSLFRREMDFKKITIVQILAKIVSGIVGIALALSGYGVWSLVWQGLMSSAANVASVWTISSWRPQFLFRKNAIQELLRFSGNLLGFNLVNYWTRSADDLLIGKFVGSAGLGIYTKAYGLMLLPVRQITSVISDVMFPALSRIQNDIDRVRRVYLRANRIIGFVTIPMMCGLMAVAHPFVLALFGPKWEAVVPVLQILCFVGVKQPVGSTTGWIYQSQGRTDWMFRWNVVVSTVTILSFVIGVQWGVIGVATAYAIRSYVVWYHGISIPGRLIDMTFGDFVQNLAGIFACAVVMAGAVYALGLALPPEWPHWLHLLTQVPAGVVIYWALVHSFGVQAYRETFDLLVEQWQRRVQASP